MQTPSWYFLSLMQRLAENQPMRLSEKHGEDTFVKSTALLFLLPVLTIIAIKAQM